MELLDCYLKAIRSYLPDAQKDDIIKELSENLRSQMEDKEGELGRPLNEGEIEALLKAHGHPLIVAGRYRQDERSFAFGKQLIGPVLFPCYTKVLAFNLGITSVVLLFVFTALIASGQPVSLMTDLPSVFLHQLLIQFTVVTTIFAVMDRHLAKYPDRWDPRRPSHPYYPNLPETDDARRVPRIESVSKLIALSVWITWLRHPAVTVLDPWPGRCLPEACTCLASALPTRGAGGVCGNGTSGYQPGSTGLVSVALDHAHR